MLFRTIEIVDPDETFVVFEGLTTGAIYHFRVYAENEGGMGDALILRTPVRIQEDLREYCFPY